MKAYNFMTTIMFALIAVLLAVAIFLHVAHAEQDRFGVFDREYCTQIEQYDYCLTFHRLPFGPGYAGEALLSWQDVTAIFGPVEQGEMSMGYVNSRDGQTFYFEQHDFFGMFRQGGLELYTGQLRMEAKPGE